jgi:hypothetical protein
MSVFFRNHHHRDRQRHARRPPEAGLCSHRTQRIAQQRHGAALARSKRSASEATPRILPRFRRWPPGVGIKEESAVAGRESEVPRADLCANGIMSSSARELVEKPFRANQYGCAGAPRRLYEKWREKRTIRWRLDRVKNTMLLARRILPLQHTVNGSPVHVHVLQPDGLHHLNAHDAIEQPSHSCGISR